MSPTSFSPRAKPTCFTKRSATCGNTVRSTRTNPGSLATRCPERLLTTLICRLRALGGGKKPERAAAAEAGFACSLCANEAGRVRLFGDASAAELRRDSFTSAMSCGVAAAQFERLRAAIASRDARALHALDLEYAPFFCPQCGAVYCGAHWVRWDVFDGDDPSHHDSIRGRCPKGHERMLED